MKRVSVAAWLLLGLLGLITSRNVAQAVIKDRHCIILLSTKLGQQLPLLEKIVAIRDSLGIDKRELPVAEFAWDKPKYRAIIADSFGLKEHQLPLASTGLINSQGLPTAANRNRPALGLPQDVIAYYLINEWARRSDQPMHPWPYKVPASQPSTLAKTRTCSIDGSTLLLVPEGKFWHGSTEGEIDELPPTLNSAGPVYVGKTEVTVAQFQSFVDATGYQTEAEERGFGFVWGIDWERRPKASWRDPEGNGLQSAGSLPVRQVSQADCQAYCEWAGLRLPTEEEWEKGARGTGGRAYSWGNEWNAAKAVSSGPGPKPVGSVPEGASAYGLLDTAGNVREWTASLYEPYSQVIPDDRTGLRYAVRGGSWSEENPKMALRTSYRFNSLGNLPNSLTGFRVAVGPESPLGSDSKLSPRFRLGYQR